ncbi:MAG: ribonuclease HII [Deltaproteobacteria bacterium]|nr:MAG: ribonuclease HII [Deltaproteobacteria bacterium]
MLQTSDRLFFEKSLAAEGFKAIAGVDEAGRGPLAGPVVASAVILPDKFSLEEVNDSKKLSPKKRERLADEICRQCIVSIGIVTAQAIDEVNIRNATLEAMRKAVFSLGKKPDCILVDGNAPINCGIYEKTIVKGDSRSVSIGAASIIAKVFRDIIMKEYALEYPRYLFEKNKGYPTREHKELISIYGLSPVHRKTFNYKQKSK